MRLACILFALGTIVGFGGAQKPETEDGQRQRLYQWFDSLGFDAIRNGQFVRVSSSMTYSGKTHKLRDEYGFLVDGNPIRFTVITPFLSFIREPSGGDPTETIKYSYQPAEFSLWLKHEEKPPKELYELQSYPNHTEFFVMSRACAARGMESEAAEAFAKLKSSFDSRNWQQKSLESDLSEEISGNVFSGIVEDFRNRFVPRAELLTRLESMESEFPSSTHLKAIRETAESLYD